MVKSKSGSINLPVSGPIANAKGFIQGFQHVKCDSDVNVNTEVLYTFEKEEYREDTIEGFRENLEHGQ